MIRTRIIGTMAALGGLTATMALLSGLPSAKADELADLRANQELLQHRLDQLAQAPISPAAGLYPGGPPAATAGAGIVGGSFPRSFLVPGTDTSIRVGGEIRLNATYYFNGGNPNVAGGQNTNAGNNGQLNSIPLHVHTGGPPGFLPAGNPSRSRGNSLTYISPQQSKVNFETRTPTAWGEARTFMEFDWANSNGFTPSSTATSGGTLQGSDDLAPRLRFAYATLGGLLGGQANSNFADPDAGPESISFGGPPGEPGVTRIPQIRYTVPLAPWRIPGALSVSAEAPETELSTNAGILASDSSGACLSAALTGSCNGTLPPGTVNPTKSPAPDLTMAWYIPQPWGHMDFSSVVRPTLEVKDGAFVDRTFTGWGVHFGGDVKPGWFGWPRDYIAFNFSYGDGIGRYLSGNHSEFALVSNYPATAVPASAAAAANVRIRTTVMWGGTISYQHRWLDNLRSSLSAGILHHDINNLGGANGFVCPTRAAAVAGAGNCAFNKELVGANVNLIWNPVPFADLGIEYYWGHRMVLSNLKGDDNVLLSRFRVAF